MANIQHDFIDKLLEEVGLNDTPQIDDGQLERAQIDILNEEIADREELRTKLENLLRKNYGQKS